MRAVEFITFIILLVFGSCSKDDNQIITNGIPFVPTNNVFVLESLEDTILTKYNYSNNWNITEIQTIINDITDENLFYTKLGNIVSKTTNKNNYVYKYFLNKKGFADSLNIVKIGYVNIKERYFYNNLGFLEKKIVDGLILNVPYSEQTNFLYVNGNLIKSEQITDNGTYIVNYEYYTDSINFLAGTLEASTFIPQSRNLIKKESSNDDTFIEYVYTLNEDSNIVVTTLNELNQVGSKTLKLFHIKD